MEWNFIPDPSISFVPPQLSLYMVSIRRQLIDHRLGSLDILGIPVEINFNGGLIVKYGLSAGGWKWVLKKLIRRLGWEPAILAFKQNLRASAVSSAEAAVNAARTSATTIARASPIPLLAFVLGVAIKYVFEEIARAERVRGYHEGLAVAFADGFTRTIWIERNFESGAGSDTARTAEAYQSGVDIAVRMLTVLSIDNTQTEVASAARKIRNHLRRAFLLESNASRSAVLHKLAERLSSGGHIPDPSANLPY